MHWFLDPITKHYADFEGRATREEYWMFILFIFGISVLLPTFIPYIFTIFLPFINIIFLLPSLAITTRRFHDVGKSGFWSALAFLPMLFCMIVLCISYLFLSKNSLFGIGLLLMYPFLIGSIIIFGLFIYFLTRSSQVGDNIYGPNPYGIQAKTTQEADIHTPITAFTPYVPVAPVTEFTPYVPPVSPVTDEVTPVVTEDQKNKNGNQP